MNKMLDSVRNGGFNGLVIGLIVVYIFGQIVGTYIGYRNGKRMGYKSGVIDGKELGRKEAIIETREKAHKAGVGKYIVNEKTGDVAFIFTNMVTTVNVPKLDGDVLLDMYMDILVGK